MAFENMDRCGIDAEAFEEARRHRCQCDRTKVEWNWIWLWDRDATAAVLPTAGAADAIQAATSAPVLETTAAETEVSPSVIYPAFLRRD